MTCSACGEHPKINTARDFPKAVIEINNPESIVLLRKVSIPASMGDDTVVPPAIGKFHNVILEYQANAHVYIYSSDGIPTKIEAKIPQEYLDKIDELEYDLDELEQEFEDFKNSPDVVDIVSTYADLQSYDTSSLGDKDVIRVLADETHDGQSAYYRWDKPNSTWVFIGTVGDYYTKNQIDIMMSGKQDVLIPGRNISIVDESGALVISSDDTIYTAGDGIDITNNTVSATNTGKLKIITEDDLDYPAGAPTGVALWELPDGWYYNTAGNLFVAPGETSGLGHYNPFLRFTYNNEARAIVFDSQNDYVQIHHNLGENSWYSVRALLDSDVVNNLTTDSSLKVLSAHAGKTLKDLIDSLVSKNAGAPTASTAGSKGQLIEDTVNGDLYICVDDSNPYVWAQIGSGSNIYELSGWAQPFKTGLLEGVGVVENSTPDMNVLVGGSPSDPDVLIAETPDNYKIALYKTAQQTVAITAPATDSRITSIVAYTEANISGSHAADNVIAVDGIASGSPTAPDDTAIRAAITADGADGTHAAYCVIAEITVENSDTAVTDSMIAIKDANSKVVTADNIDFTTLRDEQFIAQTNDDGSVTLPAGYSVYHLRGTINYTTATAAANVVLTLDSNYNSSTIYIRRIKTENNAVVGEQFDYTNGRFMAFGSSTSVGTASGSVGLDLTITRTAGARLISVCNWHHVGCNSTGLTTSEASLVSRDSDTNISFGSANGRTFKDSTIVVTGVRDI